MHIIHDHTQIRNTYSCRRITYTEFWHCLENGSHIIFSCNFFFSLNDTSGSFSVKCALAKKQFELSYPKTPHKYYHFLKFLFIYLSNLYPKCGA